MALIDTGPKVPERKTAPARGARSSPGRALGALAQARVGLLQLPGFAPPPPDRRRGNRGSGSARR
jgi:hypothetical protein